MKTGVYGVAALTVELNEAAARAPHRAQLVLRKTAADIQRSAKRRAPVDTGNLRNSISTSVFGLHAEIGPTASYGIYQELGTSVMPPHPYLTPAFDKYRDSFLQAMGKVGDL